VERSSLNVIFDTTKYNVADIAYCFKGQIDIELKESQQIVHASTKIAVDFVEKCI
jgi:hypothetical protein